ncbi:hypothetical protein PFFVO_00891 [Plasmodium falciparum Vietnam Oak-Knoll (FVO)]|uniref:Surface antigen n=1 Tax=Plasmodium falciparum Vietnam Oak-Knoll (FVO) TaxID=1036723 RepID=A0A024VCQ8_PLAFA|nr:hypothetical protein PFFVO_00891 [Plasmodium falciparum Vietnam Oak-Knoll (FVO)]
MKFSYFNILLFSIPLNILINDHSKYSSCKHTSNSKTTKPHRSLYECGLYSPANNDNDPEMKRVMQQFEDRTSQRFHEYDERMKTTRQKCKEQCDKEIQKIILKEKIEKELMDKFATLQTDIQNDAIPTCVCEKSLADKTENFCLNCGVQLGGGVLQASGLLGGIGQLGLDAWKAAELVTAKELAEKAGAAAGLKAGDALGMEIVIEGLKVLEVHTLESGIFNSFVNNSHYTEVTKLASVIDTEMNKVCFGSHPICALREKLGLVAVPGRKMVNQKDAITKVLKQALEKATSSANAKATQVAATKTAALETAQKGAIEAASTELYTTIAYSILAILIIVLIMVIIYLILRYRRKKKMKKKLQYIKLLEE